MNGVKPECLGDGVCTNPRCERHGMLGTRPQPTPEVEFDPETYEDGGTEEAQGVISSAEAAQDPWGWGVEAQRRYEADVARGMPRLPGDQHAVRPQSTLDRSAVLAVLRERYYGGVGDKADYDASVTDQIMALVRPLPTREQIAEAIHGPFCQASRECSGAQPNDYLRADMVLKLFTGGKE